MKIRKIKKKNNTNKSISLGMYSIKELGEGKFSINVFPNETISHYVDWSKTSKDKLLENNFINGLIVGKKVMLNFDENIKNDFEEKRMRFHKKIKMIYFQKHSIVGIRKYKVKRGDTLFGISKKLKIPLWLLFTLKEEGVFAGFLPGKAIKLPEIKQKI